VDCIFSSCASRIEPRVSMGTSDEDEDQGPTSKEQLCKFTFRTGATAIAIGGILDNIGTIIEFNSSYNTTTPTSMSTSPGMMNVYIGFALNVLGIFLLFGQIISVSHLISTSEDQQPTCKERLGKFISTAGAFAVALGGVLDSAGTIAEFNFPQNATGPSSISISPGMINVYLAFALNVLGTAAFGTGQVISKRQINKISEDQRPTLREQLGKFISTAGATAFALSGLLDGAGTIIEFNSPRNATPTHISTSIGMIMVYVAFGLNVLGVGAFGTGKLVKGHKVKQEVTENTPLEISSREEFLRASTENSFSSSAQNQLPLDAQSNED